ncbi:MAG: metal ABC transporter permease [Candidatus Odinarchaeota archaeon]
MNPLLFFTYLNQPWLQRAIISAFLTGIICSVIGTFVLLRGMVFLGEAIAHSAFAGAALGILLGINPFWTIILFSVGSAIGIGYVNEKKVMKDEIVIGIVFSFFMALAIFFIGLMNRYSTDINSILFGNVLSVSIENFLLLIVVSVALLITLLVIRKELYFMTFDMEMAAVSGVPVRVLSYLFLIMVSLTVSVSLRAIGAILVFAMIVTPAAAAYQWTFRLRPLLILSAVFGSGSGLLGLYISFLLDMPSSSAIVILVTVIFSVSFLLSPKRRKTSSIIECPYCGQTLTGTGKCPEVDCIFDDLPHVHDGERITIDKSRLTDKPPSVHGHHQQEDQLDVEESGRGE